MNSPVVEFFWDPASPYTYLAATQLEGLTRRTGAVLRWRPFLLGKAFEATGNRAPATIPAKGKYLSRDVRLWARYYNVPLFFPRVFPVNSLGALRIACALPDAELARWGLAVMTAYWTRDADISQPEVLREIAQTAGFDADVLLAAAQTPEVKDRLRANTEEAVARGVFGAPTFFVGDQMFWGNDRLVLLEAFLTGQVQP